MQNYLQQLLQDLEAATHAIELPFVESELSLHEWKSPEEEDAFAPVRSLPEWTGIAPEMLPPASMLSHNELNVLLEALKKLLAACNCHFVLQIAVPEEIQYETIRQNFNQEVKCRQWHDGFFALCRPGTRHNSCTLAEYCQCAFFAELFAGMTDEELTPEEERARALEIELIHIKRKYGDDWMKYYPYHLDKNFDDEHGQPYTYGFEHDEEDEDEDEDWWRK